MAAFSGLYDALIMDSVGIREPISDIEDQKSQYDVSKHLADQQYIEFAREYGVISSEEALMSWYESTMESFGLQEVIDPIIINKDHVSEALYGPSFGVDNGERAVYPETESTVNEKIQDCDVNHLQKYTPGNGENQEVTIDKGKCIDKPSRSKGKGHTTHGKTKKRKNVGGSVVEIYLQKSKRGRCKCSQSSRACKSHEKKSNTKLDVIRTDPPEMPLRIVKADGQKDYIHLRARRGQATNSHSLAERARRDKISERMKVLQELVPGCNKVAGKALVLEEIINYVQSLQKQVEILSLKLACVVPLCDSGLEINGHLSTEWSNLKQVQDIHRITMPPQTMERF